MGEIYHGSSASGDALNGDNLSNLDVINNGYNNGQELCHIGRLKNTQWQVNKNVYLLSTRAGQENDGVKGATGAEIPKLSAVRLAENGTGGQISHALTLEQGVRYTLRWVDILDNHHNSTNPNDRYTVSLQGSVTVNQTYTPELNQWTVRTLSFTPVTTSLHSVVFEGFATTVPRKRGSVVSGISCKGEATPPCQYTIKADTANLQLSLVSGRSRWDQKTDWLFSVTCDGQPVDGVPASLMLSPGAALHFVDGDPKMVTIHKGKLVLPAGSTFADATPGNPEIRIQVGQSTSNFAIHYDNGSQTRLIFSPEPTAESLTSPVNGDFNAGTGIQVGIQIFKSNEWQAKKNGTINAEIEHIREGSPCFDKRGKYSFSGKMSGVQKVTLPVIRAGVNTGTYKLTVSDADNSKAHREFDLKVLGIASFGQVEPEEHGEVSRNWTTEEGRWYVRALLDNHQDAKGQPVGFRIESQGAQPVKFHDNHNASVNGMTDKKGVAHFPPIDIPDETSSFTVYVEAGNTTPVQATLGVTITERPIVHTLEAIEWNNMSLSKPASFSVQMKDINNNLVTSGAFVKFSIANNIAGAKFSSDLAAPTPMNTDTSDTVPVCLDNGYALASSRPIACTKIGTFTLTAQVEDSTAPFYQKTISVGALNTPE